MASKDAGLILDDIIAEAGFLAEVFARHSMEEVADDRTLAHAIKYALLSIGEAAKRVPVEVRALHPTLPWREMIQTRDFLAHGYDVIKLEVLWKTVEDDVIPMLAGLQAARSSLRADRSRPGDL